MVRRKVAKQHGKVREMIVAKALWGAGGIATQQALRGVEQGEDVRLGDGGYDAQKEQEELDRLLAEIEADFEDDPTGIAQPWDEKYGEGDKAEDGKKEEKKQ